MYNKTVLVTGVTGFIGQHFVAFIKRYYPSYQIVGIARKLSGLNYNVHFHAVNLLDLENITNVITLTKPDYIFHFAGLVFSYQWDALYNGNVQTTINLLEAVKQANVDARVIIAGSSAEYGVVPAEHLPVQETFISLPKTPYAMSKLWQTMLVNYYSMLNVQVIVGRIFNVIGHGAARQLSIGDYFAQILDIMGQRKTQSIQAIQVGNLQIKRDFLDVDDACAAFLSLATKGKSGEIYNICSGVSRSLKSVLDMALSLTNIRMDILVDQNKAQNRYLEDIYGSNKKIKIETKWLPVVTLEKSIKKALLMESL